MITMAKKTPNGLKLASILIWIEATIMAIGSVMAIVMGTTVSTFLGISDLASMFVATGIVTLIIAVAWFVLGFYVWKMNTYAWYIAFIFTLLAVISGVIGLFGGLLGMAAFSIGVMSVVSLVIAVIQLFALVDKDSMKACKAKVGDWKGIDIF